MKKITQKTIDKISQTKLETSRQKILDGLEQNTLPEQSEVQLAIPSHRTRKWLTFQQFQQHVNDYGATLPELCKKYNKHLIAFYSALSKGKITITKEQFETDYNNGMSLDEIATKYLIPREHITYLREYYGIKRKGAKYINRLKNEQPLSQEAKDIIIGSLLGDGHITPNGYFSEKHSEKQVEYLEWKAEFLKPILNEKSFSIYKQFDKRYNSTNYSFCLRTITHSFLHEMRKKFYKEVDGKIIKVVPDDIGELMNEKVLAVWFMDDGSTDWMYRNGYKKTPNSRGYSKFSSQSFSYGEQSLLVNCLKNKFGMECSVMPRDKKHFYIAVSCDGSEKLFESIKPIVLPSLQYKICEQSFIEQPHYNKEEITKSFMSKHHISYKIQSGNSS